MITRFGYSAFRIVLSVCLFSFIAQAHAAQGPDPARIDEIASWMPDKPLGLGPAAEDREVWANAGSEADRAAALDRAAKIASTPVPEQPDELFLEFSKTGNRTRWQNVASSRRSRLTWLTLGECIEGKGRFIPALAETIRALCAEPTWVMPAHDASLANFHQKQIDIDLGSSALGWNLACCLHLLGGRLDDETRSLIRRNLFRRILEPYRNMVLGKRRKNWWMTTTNNWNAVCLAGVTGTAMCTIDDRKERAFFAAAAEDHITNFLKGFGVDGYCSEGVGYWNYGFGHYVMLAETLLRSTGGRLDLMALEKAAAPAAFGLRIGIVDGVCPAFADCSPDARPSQWIVSHVRQRFGLEETAPSPRLQGGSLFDALLAAFPAERPGLRPGVSLEGEEFRTWFDSSGILVCRPGKNGPSGFGAAMKGGNNAEHHNHNDVGSFLVVWKGRPVLADPGSEVYTARTFGPRRYESKVLNSWGHQVPVVAGKLQRTGGKARGVVLKTSFTPERDDLALDISSAYDAPGLKSLHRTFSFDRSGSGSFSVLDEFAFEAASAFETALVTFGGWIRKGDAKILVYDGEGALMVEIDTGGLPFVVEAATIDEDLHGRALPTRIGVRIAEPAAEGAIRMKIVPVQAPIAADGLLPLLNGDFESGGWGWDLGRNGQASIEKEEPGGENSVLRVKDDSPSDGSDAWSSPISAGGAASIELRGRSLLRSGSGLGLYLRYYDGNGTELNEKDPKGDIAPVGALTGGAEGWKLFSFISAVPDGAVKVRLWIHSFSSARIDVLLDDLVLETRQGR